MAQKDEFKASLDEMTQNMAKANEIIADLTEKVNKSKTEAAEYQRVIQST